jgi:hypothetical protein
MVARPLAIVVAFVLAVTAALAQEQAGLGKDGRAFIKAPFQGSEIEIGISARNAGAIDSLTWKDVQFIDDYDHGRELQSAANFDGHRECFNPTEAGSYKDDTGATSSSRLLSLQVTESQIVTRTRMAFWLTPGETSPSCRGIKAVNTTVLSDFELTKKVTLGAHGIPNVIEHDVTYHVPRQHRRAVFEALTAWMPSRFVKFWSYDPAKDALTPLDAKRGSQPLPLIVSTADDSFAYGIYSADLPQRNGERGGYGRSLYTGLLDFHPTTNANCVFRFREVTAGDYRFVCYSIVGSLADVKASMARLAAAAKRQQ